MERPTEEKRAFFNSLHTLRTRWKDGTFGEILADWRWIFSYSKRYKMAIAFYTILGVVSTSLGLVASVASKYVIDIITGYQTEKLGLMIAIMLGSAVFSLVFSNTISRISAKLGIDINNDIQADIFDKILDVDWKALNAYSSGDLLSRFNSDVSTVSKNAISWLPSIIIAIYNFIVTFALIWHYDKIMSLLAFASAPIMLLMSKYLIGKQRDFAKKVRETSSGMMGFEVETFTGMDTIKSFGVAEQTGQKLRKWQQKLKKISLDYNLFTIKTNVFMSVLGLIVQYAAFGYCLFLLWGHAITYGTMTLFLEQRVRLSSAFNSVVGIIPGFLTSSVSAHRIRELTDLPRERHLPETAALDPLIERGLEIRMDDLDLAYEEGEQVLGSASFRAAPGEIVALVGPSGEGKTTMVRLMLGLIYPDQGRVTLRAADGTEVDANADSRRFFSYVPQGNTLFSGTVAEILRLGREDASDEQLREALEVACAWDLVAKLPNGINSKLREHGKGISEGQAQRISIARAILRDAPILLLDEATSALDTETERKVLQNIVRRCPNKTCIVTTHRPSVLDVCDRVYRVSGTQVTVEERGRERSATVRAETQEREVL